MTPASGPVGYQPIEPELDAPRSGPAIGERPDRRYRVAFTLSIVAGNATRVQNMRRWRTIDPQVETRWHSVQPWKEGDWLGILPDRLRVKARTLLEGLPVFLESNDAVVFHAAEPYEVYAWLAWLTRRRTVIVANEDDPRDWGDNALYQGYRRPRPKGLAGRLRAVRQRRTFDRTDLFVPWTTWARDCLIRYSGIDPARIVVIHPGMDLHLWQPVERRLEPGRRPRILFVGGDFRRKGGDLLLRVFRRSLVGRCELHIVSRWLLGELQTSEAEGLFLHDGLEPNSPQLMRLYRESDIFVMPTTADFSPWVFLEAAAVSMPMIGTRIGGIPDVVQDGLTGYLIDVGNEDQLEAALMRLLADERLRFQMGQAGRALVEERYDSRRNMALLLDHVKELVERRARL